MGAGRFVYVGDPMCSWCWGFAPVVERLEERYGIPVRVMAGGLRPGSAATVLTEDLARYLAHHWDRVEELTGQPFRRDVLGWEGWRYDTELPCVAVVTMREVEEDRALPFFTRLQRAFYVENLDITSPEVYPGLVEGFGGGDRFLELLGSERMRQRAWDDFRRARSLGVSGFPTLLLQEPGGMRVVTRGYAPPERIDAVLRGTVDPVEDAG